MLAFLLAATSALAGTRPQNPSSSALRLIAHGDTVTVFLLATPPGDGGFVVYRGPSGGPMVRITAQPVRPAVDGAEAAAIVGSDLLAGERDGEALDANDMLRRLRANPFAGVVLGALYPKVALALGRIYADTGVTPGARLDYRVVVTDADGRETERAFSASVTVADRRPPAPTGLTADVGDGRAALTWTYPAPGPGAAENVIGFVVYRAGGADTAFRRMTPLPVLRTDAGPLQYEDREVTNGTGYRYRVAAVDLGGRESEPGPSLGVTPVDRTPPGFPASVSTEVQASGVLVVWRMSPEPDAAGYIVERSTSVSGPFAPVTASRVPADRPSYLDTAATGGRRYFYRVIAVDQSGNASPPSSIAQANVEDRTPPDAPTGVVATPVAHRLVVRWRRSRSPDVMGYYVYRAVPGKPVVRIVSLPLSDTVFVDSGYGAAGLRPGARYEVGVTAVDSARNESAHARAQVQVPDDVPPDPPAGLAARGIGGRYVQLAWSASQAPDVAAYEVLRSVGDTSFVPLARVTGRPPYGLRDTSTVHGGRYVYRVVAVDSAGNRSVPAVDTVRFTRPTPPAAPRHLLVRAGSQGTVALEWERVADPELAGYRVYRSPLPTGRFEPLGDAVIRGTTFTDDHPQPGAYYRVRAVDSSGNESAPSPPARLEGKTP